VSRRPYMLRFECSRAGCKEVANYEAHTRAEQTRLYQKYGNGKWLCIRHDRPNTVLGPDNASLVHEVACSEHFYQGHSIGLYWGEGGGASGFVFGPGFRAFAKDFPTGTRLRVTAEILPPLTNEAASAAHAAQVERDKSRDEHLPPIREGQ
jgi:hypothetical protein